MIDSMCENYLAESIVPKLEELFDQGYSFEVLNSNNHTFDIELVDISQVVGGHIDRRRNKDARKLGIDLLSKKASFFKIYIPKNIREKTLPMNIEMVLKITTNLKLNVVDRYGHSMIPEEDHPDKEIHFVRFESVFNEIEMNFSALMNIKNKLDKSDIQFTGWTITDFDRFLNDNPHV